MFITIDKKRYDLEYCNTFFKRFKGLMFKKNIDKILCFPKCNSIHTCFMFNSIDVIMTDKNLKILYIYKNVKPWKFILPKKDVYYTFEFKSNLYKIKKESIIYLSK